MELLCITGAAPGTITATVAHDGAVRAITLEVAAHEAGGWKARLPGGRWGLRCHAVPTAVVLEAGEALAAPVAMELAAD